MNLRYQLTLPDGASIAAAGETRLQAEGLRGRMAIEVGHARFVEALSRLDRQDVSELELYALAAVLWQKPLELVLRNALSALKRIQALSYRVSWQGRLIAQVLPLTTRAFLDRAVLEPAAPPPLSPHAFFRPCDQGLRILAPLACAEVVVDPPLAREFIGHVQGAAPGPELVLLQNVLADTGHLGGEGGRWSFADLVFHSASRLGRVWGAFGKHRSERSTAPASQARRRPESVIDLGSIDKPVPTHVSFATVMDGRRSRRAPGLDALSVGQLSAFLSLAAEQRKQDAGAPPRFPYPSGGGIYGYHIYVAANRCSGLDSGLYEYIADRHQLNKLCAETHVAASLAAHCGRALGLEGARPDTVLIIAADIGAFSANYDAIAYRLMLMGAGCLIENMYLAASALGLAGCAVGAGNPDLFARAAGADPVTEPSVAEFALSGGS